MRKLRKLRTFTTFQGKHRDRVLYDAVSTAGGSDLGVVFHALIMRDRYDRCDRVLE
jgi:hypothetical protein